ncbi:hypothetical protein B0T21DRAFT_407712 [Apiosordaria backusii]|uniref:Uncharacterized protein n=1 Tax=Apiosordaria backusii TaxID=314023 RepID=A0AA40K3J8_9PEZI|nr:hypothetical protein B0T21DRAFT_407712 [Apiosordaria backusii]
MASEIPTLTLNDAGLPKRANKRDFSDSKLKPEPLRLPRKSHGDSNTSAQVSFNSPAKSFHSHETPTLTSRRPSMHRGREAQTFLELTPPTRTTAPGLASLVSKFEILDAVSNVNAQDTRHGVSPSKPAPASVSSVQKQNRARPRTEPRPIFAEGSPFTKAPRIALPVSDPTGPDSEVVSPRTPTPAPDLKLHDLPFQLKQEHGRQKRDSGIISGERKGWDPKLVSERRKIFEQRSGDPFTSPILTRAAVRSSKPVFVEHTKAVASLRASRTSETDFKTGGNTSTARNSRSKPQSQSSMDPGRELENTVKRNRHSVADLRMAFDRAGQTGLSSTKSSLSKEAQRGSQPGKGTSTTKKASSEETFSPQPRQLNYKQSNSETPRRPVSQRSSDHTQAPATEPIDRRRTRVLAEAFEHGGKLKGSSSRPLLQIRTLSVKISTVKPVPDGSPTKESKQKVAARLSDTGVGRRVLPGPPPSPFLQYWRTRRETLPVKSGPSLPIMVSTTVAARTHRDSSSIASSSRRSTPFPARADEALRKSTGSSSQYGRLSQDGAGEGRTKDSPVKDRIGMFEHLSRPETGSSGTGSQKSKGSSQKALRSCNSAKRPVVPELRRGARALRALSLTGRKESKTRDALSKAADVGSKLPIRARHSVAVVKQGPTKDGEVSLSPNTSAKPLGSRVMRANTTAKSDGLSLTPRQDSTFFVKGTMWKVPRMDRALVMQRTSAPKEAQPPRPSYQPPSSTELANKTIDTKPTLFHPSTTTSGRILPDRKSYGALEQKPSWETSHTGGTAPLTDPFFDSTSAHNTTAPVAVSGGDGHGYGLSHHHHHHTPSVITSVTHEATSTTSLSPTTTHYSPAHITPSTSAIELPRPHLSTTITSAGKKHHSPLYPSSFGKKAGESWKKSAGVGPVLSPDLVHAVKDGGSRRHGSLSWGKRAAAAALGITRRLKERRASSSAARHSHSHSQGGVQNEGGHLISPRKMMQQRSREGSTALGLGHQHNRERERERKEGMDWDVVVATPNCRLQHPRPSRVVDWRRWEESGVGVEGGLGDGNNGGYSGDGAGGPGEGDGGKRVMSVQSAPAEHFAAQGQGGQRKANWAKL